MILLDITAGPMGYNLVAMGFYTFVALGALVVTVEKVIK